MIKTHSIEDVVVCLRKDEVRYRSLGLFDMAVHCQQQASALEDNGYGAQLCSFVQRGLDRHPHLWLGDDMLGIQGLNGTVAWFTKDVLQALVPEILMTIGVAPLPEEGKDWRVLIQLREPLEPGEHDSWDHEEHADNITGVATEVSTMRLTFHLSVTSVGTLLLQCGNQPTLDWVTNSVGKELDFRESTSLLAFPNSPYPHSDATLEYVGKALRNKLGLRWPNIDFVVLVEPVTRLPLWVL